MKNKYKKKEKWFWEKQFGLSYGQLDNINPVIDKLYYRDTEVNDDDLFWIATRIRTINRFDLDNTLITDEGIMHLAGIAITELRLKNCRITKASLPILNKIETLELLHLGSTDIILDDLFEELTNLKYLKLLLVDSNDSEENIKEKVAILREELPGCAFIVNHNSY